MNLCCTCGTIIKNRFPQARYCTKECKYKANRNTDSIEVYTTSTHGRAVTLWHNSKSRDVDHSITVEFIKNKLDLGICEATGIPFEFNYKKGKQPYSPSLDRINSEIGYTPENTRVVIWMYNAAKNVFSDGDVLYMAKCLVNKDGSLKSQTSRRERKK